MTINNDAEASVGRVRLADVARAFEGLEPGPYERGALYDRYAQQVLSDSRTPGTSYAFGRALNELGCERETVWRIDPARLKRRWPCLPWS